MATIGGPDRARWRGGAGGSGGSGGGAGERHAHVAPLTPHRTYSTIASPVVIPSDDGVLQAPTNHSEQYDWSSGCSKPLQFMVAMHPLAQAAAVQGARAELWL